MKKLTTWLIIAFAIFDIIGIIALSQDINIYSFIEQPRAIDKRAEYPKAILIPQKLTLKSQKRIKAGAGVKSVLIDPQNEYLYAFNLEAMNVYEYNVKTKEQTRQLVFKPTKGKGFDYSKREWYETYKEKPVEGCFTHNGRYLWISLHNAEGVIVWDRKSTLPFKKGMKPAFIEGNSGQKEKVGLYFFKTGKTPKVISASPKDDFIFVANWHDNTVTVIDIKSGSPEKWKVADTIKTGAVPRGNVVSDDGKRFFLGHMGSSTIAKYTIDNTLEFDTLLKVGITPRHLVYHHPYLYASLSSPEKLLKIDVQTNRVIKEVKTGDDPRTIALSPDRQLIFVTCYADNIIQAFRAHDLQKVGSWESKGKPVGISVRQQKNVYEVWVCNYTARDINVFELETAP